MSCRGRQTWNPALACHHSSRNFGESKPGTLPRNDNVTITDEFRTAAKTYPIHGSDERFGESPPSGNRCETRVSCRKRIPTRCGFKPTAKRKIGMQTNLECD